MNFPLILSTCFIAVWLVLISSTNDFIAQFVLTNAAAQGLLFLFVVCIPIWRTGRLSYVDLGWPFGLALIGVQVVMFVKTDSLSALLVGCIYLAVGLRMGLGALFMGRKTGVIFKHEFPRYQYRHILLEETGAKHPQLQLQLEAITQGLANISVLAMPAIIISTSNAGSLVWLEIVGFCLWALAYVIESIADSQKLLFIGKNPKDAVCNIGLWRYSRHPNYFAEWLVWCGLAIAALPAWLAMQGSVSLPVWLIFGLALMAAPLVMYITLVYLTGAQPAEYLSVRKRPSYAEYQRKTSIFFPWFPKQ